MTRFFSVLALAAFVLVPLTGCDSNDNSDDDVMVVSKTIVETAIDADDFNTLVAAVQAADLVATLEGPGPFTVFAPTDAAFAALPDGTVDELLQPDNKGQLVDVLTYHVVAGKITSDQVVSLTSATTVQGSDISIEVVDGTVLINGATLLQADIQASNGVIHVIDSVLLPGN
ncbi:MAG: putative surface protein with fasciclin (FAS1) repeats [Rhodothermales bacterium]|jgi:uncharacterized surface protein with fasciclin (FAS1) repeats